MDEIIMVPALPALQDYEAQVNVTWDNQNGDLPGAIAYDSSDDQIKRMVAEAIRNGNIPGIQAADNVNFEGYMVDRFPINPAQGRLVNRLMVRPKTAFGA